MKKILIIIKQGFRPAFCVVWELLQFCAICAICTLTNFVRGGGIIIVLGEEKGNKLMFNFKKNNSDTSENVNKSYIKRKFNGIRSVALLGAVALSLGGCLSLQEYKEYKKLKEENERYEWQLPRDVDAELEMIESGLQNELDIYKTWVDNKNNRRITDIIELIDEYNAFCAENTFDYTGVHKNKIDGYNDTIKKCIVVLKNYLEYVENGDKELAIESVDDNLDLAQETFGELQGYLIYVQSIQPQQTATQSEETELELE